MACALFAPRASAEAVPPANAPELSPDAHVDIATTPPEGQTTLPTPPPEAPPPRPRHEGLVLETTLGALGFIGQFGHVAPPAFWMHAQLGYEVLPWLMFFGEGELAFTETSESQDPSHSIAFPMWGFGAGGRGTLLVSSRVAAFVQAEVGELTAYVPHGALAALGYRTAEALAIQWGGRLGVEWHATDRHMALCLEGGLRDATGFARAVGTGTDLGLLWDGSAGFRYTF
jgi:hypothetical protein